jgi:hypothetical protein
MVFIVDLHLWCIYMVYINGKPNTVSNVSFIYTVCTYIMCTREIYIAYIHMGHDNFPPQLTNLLLCGAWSWCSCMFIKHSLFCFAWPLVPGGAHWAHWAHRLILVSTYSYSISFNIAWSWLSYMSIEHSLFCCAGLWCCVANT